MEDPWDTRYVISFGKGVIADILIIFTFVMFYMIYNLIIKNIIVLPLSIITNEYFLINNFILLLILTTYFVYRSREIV